MREMLLIFFKFSKMIEFYIGKL